jgi:hypothetical protein
MAALSGRGRDLRRLRREARWDRAGGSCRVKQSETANLNLSHTILVLRVGWQSLLQKMKLQLLLAFSGSRAPATP